MSQQEPITGLVYSKGHIESSIEASIESYSDKCLGLYTKNNGLSHMAIENWFQDVPFEHVNFELPSCTIRDGA